MILVSDQTTPGVLVLPDIAYERKPLHTKINGEAFRAEGWVNGPGCPGRVKAEYARRLKQFAAAFGDFGEEQAAAYQEFLTDALRIIFEMPLSEHDRLDLLAGDKARAEQILTFYGWRDEDDADPEAEGEDGSANSENSITPQSSPTSVQPTRRRRTAAAG